MKKILLFAMTLAIGAAVSAEVPADGYYRVQNAKTKRYAYLLDNKGQVNNGSTTVDVGALQLYKQNSDLISDPSAIFYVERAANGKNRYDICGQGTSVYGFLNRYLYITESSRQFDGKDAFYIYGTEGGASKYIGDGWSDLSVDKGMPTSEATGEYRMWYFNKISTATNEYFGAAPDVEAAGKYYCPMYAGFPMSAASEGMRMLIVDEIDSRGAAIVREVEGTVPAATAFVIECEDAEVYNNVLNVGGNSEVASVEGNLLKGVYFHNNTTGKHRNVTPFDKETMRVLGVKDGRPAFVESDVEFIPRNRAYLQLTDPSQYATKDFILMTSDERDAELGAVAVIPVSSSVDVYRLDGTLVRQGISKEEVFGLNKGLYIIRSGSASEKVAVR